MPIANPGPLPWVSGLTIGRVLEQTVSAHPDRDALVFPALGLRWSWTEFGRRVERVARALFALGVARGEHVGIWSMNAPEWVVTQFAAARLGAVLVNVNPAYRLFELEDALRLADVTTLVVGSAFKSSDFVGMVHSVCPEVAAASDREWSSERLPSLKRLIALGDRPGPGWLSWNDLEAGPACPLEDLDCRQRQLAASDVVNVQFTSGTTGLPKGAMLTHANLLMNAFYVGQRLRYTAEDRVCVPVPFYHCFGCVLGNMVCAVYGATIVVPAPAFDPGATLAAMAAERCTSVYGVPTMFVGMLEHSDFPQLQPLQLADRHHVGGTLSAAVDGKGGERDGSARGLHRLRPDRGVANHHIHFGRRPDRGSLRDRRPTNPGSRGEAGGPGKPGRLSAGRTRRARRPRPRRDGRLLQEPRGYCACHRS